MIVKGRGRSLGFASRAVGQPQSAFGKPFLRRTGHVNLTESPPLRCEYEWSARTNRRYSRRLDLQQFEPLLNDASRRLFCELTALVPSMAATNCHVRPGVSRQGAGTLIMQCACLSGS